MNAARRLLRIQYASDLHLELVDKTPFQAFLKPIAPVLALAGDIGRPDRRSYRDFLHYCSRNWDAVFVVAGNHELYNSRPKYQWKHVSPTSIETVEQRLTGCQLITDEFENVHFLDRTRRMYSGIAFLGTTLWTNTRGIEGYSMRMNDYNMICAGMDVDEKGVRIPRPLTAADTQVWHERDRAWLAAEIAACEEAGQPAVVITHHLPTFGLVAAKYEHYGALNGFFASSCDSLIREPVRAWIAGHSHTSVTIHPLARGGGSITCTLNPRGYPGELGTGYSPEIFVDVSVEPGIGPDARNPALVAAADADATADATEPPATRSRAASSQSLEWV